MMEEKNRKKRIADEDIEIPAEILAEAEELGQQTAPLLKDLATH